MTKSEMVEAGVALVIAGAALLVAEAHAPGGVLGVMGAVVLAIGVEPAESRPDVPEGARLVHMEGDLMRLPVPGAPRFLRPAGDNELFRRMSAIAQPGYFDESVPRHPARAVIDLKHSLGPGTRVVAPPGDAGLWVARTFPTDRLGSVVVQPVVSALALSWETTAVVSPVSGVARIVQRPATSARRCPRTSAPRSRTASSAWPSCRSADRRPCG